MDSWIDFLVLLGVLAVLLLGRLLPQIQREFQRQQAQTRPTPPGLPPSPDPDRPSARRDASPSRQAAGLHGTDAPLPQSPRTPWHRPASEEALEQEPWWPPEVAPEGEEAPKRKAAGLLEAEAEELRIREQARSRREARSPAESLAPAGAGRTGETVAPRPRRSEAGAPDEEPLRPAPEPRAGHPPLPRDADVRKAFRFMELIRPPVTLRRGREELP